MVTEELPVGCSTCFTDGSANDLPDTPLPSAELSRNPSGSFDKENDVQIQRVYPAEPSANATSTNAINTPPESPRIAALQPARAGNNGHRRDSSFRKTYDEADKKRAIPCENCALTLPKKVTSRQLSPGAPKALDSNGSPILRTRKPYELIASSVSPSPKSSPSDSDEPDRHHQPPAARRQRRRSILRPVASSSASSTSSTTSTRHTHYLDYTSAHDPLTTSSFSLLRAACLRTLSCETLPPTISSTLPPSSPFAKSPSSAGPSSTTAPSASASGGPIFFGDPLAGYTTAFIFRIPDPCARGRRRVYAFLCLSATGERKAMRAFGFLAGAFRELAGWIQGLAEAEADRGDGEIGAEVRGAGRERMMPTSSFLGGRQAAAAKGYEGEGGRGRGGMGMGMGIRGVRSRGLAELVGRPDFFIELHVRFVALLAQLRFLIEGS